MVAQIDELMLALEVKKKEIISQIGDTISRKLNALSKQSHTCLESMKSVSALLEYTDEVIKEENPASFLLISSSLCSRCVLLIFSLFFNSISLFSMNFFSL